FREDKDDIWQRLYDDLMQFTESECKKRGLTYSVHYTINTPPCHCDKKLIDLIEDCAKKSEVPYMHMISYPAHDSMQMGRFFPMGMIFLRSSNDGKSHCPEEYTTKEDLAAGAQVLLNTLLEISEKNIF
ncbi:MAG: M20/M25/M40 family metallo-hydrolase, partial [Bacillota bacterium]|nr:M20/M25/M40 family metallo-hydrolase [Bacillota bacterium]